MIDLSLFPILDKLNRLSWRADDPNLGECQCPAHEDSTNSLHVTLKEDESGNPKILLHCHAGCDTVAIVRALNETYSSLFPDRTRRNQAADGKKGSGSCDDKGKPVKVYSYRDATGKVLHQTLRYEPKKFTQRRAAEPNKVYNFGKQEYRSFKDPQGNWWINTLNGIDPLPYRLPEILASTPNQMIFLCEGEKDADNLAKAFNCLTTTVPMGSGKWRKCYNAHFEGRRVVIIPDMDKPRTGQTDPMANTGVDGAKKIARELISIAAEVRILYLPDLGKLTPKWDVSDWLAAGGTKQQFGEALGAAPILTAGDTALLPAGIQSTSDSPELPADGEAVAQNLPSTSPAESTGKPIAITNFIETADGSIPRSMSAILSDISKATGGWPRKVSSQLFVHDKADGVSFLKGAAAMFGWLGTKLKLPTCFKTSPGFHGKAETHEEILRTAQTYDCIELFPHFPEMPGRYYAHGPLPDGNGRTLESLLDRFSPATEVDKQLLLCFGLTLVCGTRKRPVFVISADGRGAGKTTLAELFSGIVGGAIQIGSNDSDESIKQRLLSPEGLTKRVIIIDNVKSRKLSSASLEALATSEQISGKSMYVGEASRPNNFTIVVTANGLAFSQDMAQRSVIIKIRRSVYEEGWERDTAEFIRLNRPQILADLIWWLKEAERWPLARNTRWADWESEVLRRMVDPDEVQRVILSRQKEVDVDQDEGVVIESAFAARLLQLNYSPGDMVRIPGRIAAEWVNDALGERLTTTKCTQRLSEMIESGIITRMVCKRTADFRGFVWFDDWDPKARHETDLEKRILEVIR